MWQRAQLFQAGHLAAMSGWMTTRLSFWMALIQLWGVHELQHSLRQHRVQPCGLCQFRADGVLKLCSKGSKRHELQVGPADTGAPNAHRLRSSAGSAVLSCGAEPKLPDRADRDEG